jgi:hypothetical protein
LHAGGQRAFELELGADLIRERNHATIGRQRSRFDEAHGERQLLCATRVGDVAQLELVFRRELAPVFLRDVGHRSRADLEQAAVRGVVAVRGHEVIGRNRAEHQRQPRDCRDVPLDERVLAQRQPRRAQAIARLDEARVLDPHHRVDVLALFLRDALRQQRDVALGVAGAHRTLDPDRRNLRCHELGADAHHVPRHRLDHQPQALARVRQAHVAQLARAEVVLAAAPGRLERRRAVDTHPGQLLGKVRLGREAQPLDREPDPVHRRQRRLQRAIRTDLRRRIAPRGRGRARQPQETGRVHGDALDGHLLAGRTLERRDLEPGDADVAVHMPERVVVLHVGEVVQRCERVVRGRRHHRRDADEGSHHRQHAAHGDVARALPAVHVSPFSEHLVPLLTRCAMHRADPLGLSASGEAPSRTAEHRRRSMPPLPRDDAEGPASAIHWNPRWTPVAKPPGRSTLLVTWCGKRRPSRSPATLERSNPS